MRPFRIAAALAVLLMAPAVSDAQYVGNPLQKNAFPFGGAAESFAGTVYQQVYSASNFAAGSFLTELRFFLYEASPGLGEFREGTYDFYLSTTSAAVNGLSTTFDDNRGSDNMLFGSFFLSGAMPAVLSFSGTGFWYDPLLGNLLLDIRVTSVDNRPYHSYLYSDLGTAVGMYSRMHDFGSGFDDTGLNTEFVFGSAETTVPEPATMALLATGLAGITAARRRRKT